jgi:hypothetical protein
MSHQRAQVLAYYRQFLRLSRRLPPDKAAAAAGEVRAAIRARAGERDPVKALDGAKELAARVAFLRMTTPRPPGEPLGSGRFVWREGKWQEGDGETKGARCVRARARLRAGLGGCRQQPAAAVPPARCCAIDYARPQGLPPSVCASLPPPTRPCAPAYFLLPAYPGWQMAAFPWRRPSAATRSTTSVSTASPCPKRCCSEPRSTAAWVAPGGAQLVCALLPAGPLAATHPPSPQTRARTLPSVRPAHRSTRLPMSRVIYLQHSLF